MGNSHNLHESKMAARTILENFQATYLKMMYKTSFIGVQVCRIHFWCLGQGNVKIKMAVQRHLENGTFKLVVIAWCTSIMRL